MLDQRTQKTLTRYANAELTAFARRHSVVLGLAQRPHHYIGSGTCIQVGHRYFIATVAHNLLDQPAESITIVHANEPGLEYVPIHRIHTCGGERDDVGIIELIPEVAVSLHRDFLSLGRLGRSKAELGKGWLFLFGFPAALARESRAMPNTYGYSSLGFITCHVPPEKYPDGADPARDLVLDYPEVGEIGPEDRRFPMPNLPGVSGGSVWYYNPNLANPLVGTHNARLVGIQRSWMPRRRVALATRIEQWLDFVRACYPDLEGFIPSSETAVWPRSTSRGS